MVRFQLSHLLIFIIFPWSLIGSELSAAEWQTLLEVTMKVNYLLCTGRSTRSRSSLAMSDYGYKYEDRASTPLVRSSQNLFSIIPAEYSSYITLWLENSDRIDFVSHSGFRELVPLVCMWCVEFLTWGYLSTGTVLCFFERIPINQMQ